MDKFTIEEKLRAVQQFIKGTEGYRNLALQLGIELKTFYYWIKRFKYHGKKAFEKNYTSFTTALKR